MSETLESGTVNEEVREVVAKLNESLNEQSTSMAALLDQIATCMSKGPGGCVTTISLY